MRHLQQDDNEALLILLDEYVFLNQLGLEKIEKLKTFCGINWKFDASREEMRPRREENQDI